MSPINRIFDEEGNVKIKTPEDADIENFLALSQDYPATPEIVEPAKEKKSWVPVVRALIRILVIAGFVKVILMLI